MFKKINKLVIDTFSDEHEETEMVYLYLMVIFSISNCIWNFLYSLVLFGTGGTYLAYFALSNFIMYAISIYFVFVRKKVAVPLYLMTIAVCLYVLGCSYLAGYYKSSFILLIPLFFSLNTFSFLSIFHTIIWAIIISATHILIMYFKFNVTSYYENSLFFVEWINILIGVVSLIYIIYSRKIGEKFLERYKEIKIKKLEHQANTDFLTGLWNRTFIKGVFEKENFEENGESYIILGDIDFFKKVNDTYGHIAGDEVLREIARELKNSFRDEDYCVRWGGEEFLFFVKNIKSFDVVNKLEEIRLNILKKVVCFEETKINVTMTFGVKKINGNLDITENIDLADRALYYGKHNGRNQIVYYEDIITKVE